MKWTMTTEYKAKPPAGRQGKDSKNCKKEPSDVEEDRHTRPFRTASGAWGTHPYMTHTITFDVSRLGDDNPFSRVKGMSWCPLSPTEKLVVAVPGCCWEEAGLSLAL